MDEILMKFWSTFDVEIDLEIEWLLDLFSDPESVRNRGGFRGGPGRGRNPSGRAVLESGGEKWSFFSISRENLNFMNFMCQSQGVLRGNRNLRLFLKILIFFFVKGVSLDPPPISWVNAWKPRNGGETGGGLGIDSGQFSGGSLERVWGWIWDKKMVEFSANFIRKILM